MKNNPVFRIESRKAIALKYQHKTVFFEIRHKRTKYVCFLGQFFFFFISVYL